MPHTVTRQVEAYDEPTADARFVHMVPNGTACEQEPGAVNFTGGTVVGVPLSVQAGVSAAGSTESDATVLNGSDVTEVSTTGLNTGVKLPLGVAGQVRFIYNGGANALDIYPFVDGSVSIDAAAVDIPLIIAANVGVTLHAVSAALWITDK